MNITDAIVFFAGSTWDEIPGTDVNLALALSDSTPIIWVDPAVPATHYVRSRSRPPNRTSIINENLVRFSVVGLPGSSKAVSRTLTQAYLHHQLRSYLRESQIYPSAVIVASPSAAFPRGVGGTKAFVVTDNWPAGAHMMGIDRARVIDLMTRNLQAADVVTAVSPALTEYLKTLSPKVDICLLPNGCSPDMFAMSSERPPDVAASPYAVLAGHVNERIDVTALNAVAHSGVKLVIVGPRTESDPACTEAIDQLFDHPNVSWVGSKSRRETSIYITHAAVGITPYRINDFNAQSFPLKTLDYLSAGIPVVSTDLPATRWLNTDLVTLAGSPDEFAKIVEEVCRNPIASSTSSQARRELAASHSWNVRANRFRQLLEESADRQSGQG